MKTFYLLSLLATMNTIPFVASAASADPEVANCGSWTLEVTGEVSAKEMVRHFSDSSLRVGFSQRRNAFVLDLILQGSSPEDMDERRLNALAKIRELSSAKGLELRCIKPN